MIHCPTCDSEAPPAWSCVDAECQRDVLEHLQAAARHWYAVGELRLARAFGAAVALLERDAETP